MRAGGGHGFNSAAVMAYTKINPEDVSTQTIKTIFFFFLLELNNYRVANIAFKHGVMFLFLHMDNKKYAHIYIYIYCDLQIISNLAPCVPFRAQF